jgi:hypothetical protein
MGVNFEVTLNITNVQEAAQAALETIAMNCHRSNDPPPHAQTLRAAKRRMMRATAM